MSHSVPQTGSPPRLLYPMFDPAVTRQPAGTTTSLLPSNDGIPGEICKDQDQLEACSNNVGPYAWPSRYFRRQSVSLEWENFPWIRRKEAVNSPENDLTYFFRVNECSEQDRYRIESVVDICHDATLEELRDSVESCPEDKVALLIESCIKNDQAKFRPWLGALSPKQLLEGLLKEVVLNRDYLPKPLDVLALTSGSGSTSATLHPKILTQKADACKRPDASPLPFGVLL